MPVRYFHPSSDDFVKLPTTITVDDSVDWWAGAQKCFASIALATVIATSALAANLNFDLQQQDEIPPGTLHAVPEEQFWQNPTAPVPKTFFQELPYLPDPDEIPAARLSATVDEYFW